MIWSTGQSVPIQSPRRNHELCREAHADVKAGTMTPRKWLSIAVPLLVLALTAGCGVGQGSAKVLGTGDPIKVGVIPVADFAPVYVALDEGYFADEGLNVQTQVVQNAAAIAPSVINGQLQFGTAATTPFIAAAQKGLPVQAVANAADVATDAEQDVSALLVGEELGGEAARRLGRQDGGSQRTVLAPARCRRREY